MTHLSRRAILATGVAVLGGCVQRLPFGGSPPDYVDIYVVNQSDTEIGYDLKVEDLEEENSDQRVLIDDSRRLSGKGTKDNDDDFVKYLNPITEPGSYSLHIETSTAQATNFSWDETSEPASQQGDADGIIIHLYRDFPIHIEWEIAD